jgi:hypothetical protein
MEEERQERDTVYPELITITIEFEEVFLELHKNLTVRQAIKEVTTDTNHTCFALTPKNALALATGLIDGAFYSKVQKEAVAKGELPNEKES